MGPRCPLTPTDPPGSIAAEFKGGTGTFLSRVAMAATPGRRRLARISAPSRAFPVAPTATVLHHGGLQPKWDPT